MDVGAVAGVYITITDIKVSYRFPNECSVFQDEILGIIRAGELVKSYSIIGSEVTLYVNSQVALKPVGKYSTKSRLVSTHM